MPKKVIINKLRKQIPFSMVLAVTAALTLASVITQSDAAVLDSSHMQDASGANNVVTNQVVRKGWGFIQGDGLRAIEDDPINYGITFDELPLLVVNFANSRPLSSGDPASLAECTDDRKVIGTGVDQTTSGFSPKLRTSDGLGLPIATNYCYTWIAIGRHDASYDGETDPVFGSSVSAGITSTDIGNWDAAFGWGDHSGQGYLTSYTETDPEVGTNSLDYVPKWDGSTLSQGTIFDNGSVGIGNTAPNGKLEVTGNTIIRNPEQNGALIFSPSSVGYGVNSEFVIQSSETGAGNNSSFHLSRNAIFRTSDDTYQYIDGTGQEASKFEFNSNGDITFSSAPAGTGTVSFTDNLVMKNGGNVGIGTNSPATKLEVNGIITSTGGTSTQWNEAYSWGDHSTEGYLTSQTDDQLLSLVTNTLSIEDGNSVDLGNIRHKIIQDGDNDTKIQVEESADEDSIRFDAGGTQVARFRKTTSGDLMFEPGTSTVFIGGGAGNISTTGPGNLAIGPGTGAFLGTASYNTLVGGQAGRGITTGTRNAIFGRDAGVNVNGNYNAFFGTTSGATATGSGNVYVGEATGYLNTSGNNNVFVGYSAGTNVTSSSGNVFIGYGAGANASGNNKLYIDNSTTGSPLIYGDFGANSITINGNLNVTGSCTGCSSDLRLKTDISALKNSLDKILKLNGKNYEWKAGISQYDIYPGEQIGVIAQDVEEVFPEIVGIDSEGYKFVDYQKLTVPLIEAVKELKAEKDAEIAQKDKEIAELKFVVCELKPTSDICN